ncbi:hypothetical protein [Hymenobacter sp. B81]|uniref:hypothetical protein n=1 Tax=Hymenobacter sp. B81 TaxID=3344878 RepID=UPI0037DD9798
MIRIAARLAAGLLPLLTACQANDSPPEQAAVQPSTTPEITAAPPDRTAGYLADLRVGDVLVVRFFPEGGSTPQFYFYQVFRLTPDSVLTHPALEPALSAEADVRRPSVFAPQAVRAYTRAELLAFQREDPLDPQHSRLVKVVRN